MDRCVGSTAVMTGKEAKKNKRRRVGGEGYAVERHDESPFTQKQPERRKNVNEQIEQNGFWHQQVSAS